MQIFDSETNSIKEITEKEYLIEIEKGKENSYKMFKQEILKIAQKNNMTEKDVSNALYLISHGQIQDLLNWYDSREFINKLI